MTTTTADRAAHRVTRDALLATRTGSLANYSATSDALASYAIIGPVPGDADSVYAIGRRHQNLAMVTRTGTVNVRGRGAQVRVRIRFAFDTGDLAGTLGFVTEGTGGVAPRVLFG
jgi:hypothetical protein